MICSQYDREASGDELLEGWTECTGDETTAAAPEVLCEECTLERDYPDYEPPNCYVPGYGWRVV